MGYKVDRLMMHVISLVIRSLPHDLFLIESELAPAVFSVFRCFSSQRNIGCRTDVLRVHARVELRGFVQTAIFVVSTVGQFCFCLKWIWLACYFSSWILPEVQHER